MEWLDYFLPSRRKESVPSEQVNEIPSATTTTTTTSAAAGGGKSQKNLEHNGHFNSNHHFNPYSNSFTINSDSSSTVDIYEGEKSPMKSPESESSSDDYRSGTDHSRMGSNDTLNTSFGGLSLNGSIAGDHSPAHHKKPEKLSYSAFMEIWKKPDALPLNAMVKKCVKEFIANANDHVSPTRQSQLVQNFYLMIEKKIPENPLWTHTTAAERDHALEGIEKTLMNKIFDYAFSPRGSDDAKLDESINQRILQFHWVELRHFDVKIDIQYLPYLARAQAELMNINKFKSPRDKVTCILNVCKVLYNLIKKLGTGDSGADAFFPLLVYTVLQSNPFKLVSNCEYIQRYRNSSKLRSETGYYLTNLLSSIAFIENMDANSLTLASGEYEKNMKQLDPSKLSSNKSPNHNQPNYQNHISNHNHNHNSNSNDHRLSSASSSSYHNHSNTDESNENRKYSISSVADTGSIFSNSAIEVDWEEESHRWALEEEKEREKEKEKEKEERERVPISEREISWAYEFSLGKEPSVY